MVESQTRQPVRRYQHLRWGGFLFAGTTAFLTVWTTIVRDDGSGEGHLMVVMAAATIAFTVRLHSAGMARGMLGLAVMQAAMGALMATDPSTPMSSGRSCGAR